jgi:tRNA pseudouridine32 synthase/23S rRNA pseudouridine746 synthase
MDAVTYWYEGRSPLTGEWLKLPRTREAETSARALMQELAQDQRYHQEGKMYGILLVEDAAGKQQILKAFSGLLQGESLVDGWVPPIPGRAAIGLEETVTLSQLEAIKQELIALETIPERSHLAHLTQQFTLELQQLAITHHQRQQLRQQQRQILQETLLGEALDEALQQLIHQSQQDGIERRKLKAQQKEQLEPWNAIVAAANARMQTLKQQRKQLSKQLQTRMYEAYYLTNFAGTTVSLSQFMPNTLMPTGTGDCCAPKLLHYAAAHGFTPLAMAEFWWGQPSIQDDKIPGEFYGACRDRCQPLLGFLLAGIEPAGSRQQAVVGEAGEGQGEVSLLYEDEWVVVVDKPAGLLSVPGRYHDRQDSVLSRLRLTQPELRIVHRLDQDTSGILLLAQDLQTYRHLSQQFQTRQVHKVYEALLAGSVPQPEGVIELPLWGDPTDRPRQTVDWKRGKPSTTKFRVMQHGPLTRVEFWPLTGRTHQLRVHAAHPQGLGTPILGDRWYGSMTGTRLHLHARELIIQHPHTGRSLHLQSIVPF